MDEFEKVEMSYKNRGLPSLFSQPLFVEILLGPSRPEVNEILRGYFKFQSLLFYTCTYEKIQAMEVVGKRKKSFEMLRHLHLLMSWMMKRFDRFAYFYHWDLQ